MMADTIEFVQSRCYAVPVQYLAAASAIQVIDTDVRYALTETLLSLVTASDFAAELAQLARRRG
jgi:hypothetical protein